MRKFLAALSACAVAVSVVAYVQSLSGTVLEDRLPWVIALAIGAVAIQIPIFVLERSSLKEKKFFWSGFGRGVPRWATTLVKLFWLVVLAHFVWFFVKTDRAVPVIKDGQWILSSRGRIIRVLTRTEYLALKADELRVFAVLMIACYLAPMFYWWFPRNHQQPG